MIATLLVGFVLSGQTPPATRVPSGTSSIEGLVIGETVDHRVHDAKVTLSPSDNGRAVITTYTDRNGHYLIEGLAAGDYTIKVERAGFASFPMPAEWRTFLTSNGEIRMARLPAGKRTTFNVKLFFSGAIRGTITDDTGAPVAKARLSLSTGSSTHSTPVETNAKGEYFLDGIVPGSYYVRVTTTDLKNEAYYPGVLKWQDATLVRVGSGDTITDINFFFPGKLRGTFASDIPGVPKIRLLSVSHPGSMWDALIKNETFAFESLSDGRYLITAVLAGQSPRAAWRSVDLQGNSTSVDLFLQPTGTLRGRVVVQGLAAPFDQTYIGAALSDYGVDIDVLTADRTEVGADGRFELPGLFGGRTLRVINAPAGCIVTEIRRRGAVLQAPHVTFSGAETIADLEIVLSCS